MSEASGIVSRRAARNAAGLVWAFVIVGLGVSICSVYMGNRALADIRAERARAAAVSDAVRTFVASLGWSAAEQQAQLNRMLTNESPPPTDLIAPLKSLVKEFGATSAGAELEPAVAAMEGLLPELAATCGRCATWQHDHKTLMFSLEDKKKQAEASGSDIRAALDSAEGRRQLRMAVNLRRFRQLRGKDADALARDIVSGISPSNDISELRAEILNLSILCEQLVNENDIAQLSDLKDNLFAPSLLRMARLAANPGGGDGPNGKRLTEMLEDFRHIVLGQAYQVDEVNGTFIPGDGGLYALCREGLVNRQRRETLRAEIVRQFTQYERIQGMLGEEADALSRRLAEQSQRALDATWRKVVFLGAVRAILSIVLGLMITSIIRRQIRVIEVASGAVARLAAIVESSADAIISETLDGKFSSWNRGAEMIFGFTASEAVSRQVEWLEPSHESDETQEVRASVLRGEPCERYETRRIRKDGRQIDVSISMSAVRNEAGEIVGLSKIVSDITRRRTAEQELRKAHADLEIRVEERTKALSEANTMLSLQMEERRLAEQQVIRAKEAAEAANQSKSEFLANTSHEIRTPMTAILGYADMLLELDQSAEERIEAVRTIRRNGEHLLSVLNDILDISKIEAGKLLVETRAVNPRQLLAEILSLMRVQAWDKQLNLDARFNGLIPQTIQTDPTRLRQILINLVGNAIKFTESGGVNVVVSLEADDKHSPAQLRFEVIDSGIGLTGEQIERMFQPFTQADTSTTRCFGGTGLGLTIGRRLAQMLGGNIAVQSRPGCGSRFVLTIGAGDLTGVPLRSEDSEMVDPAATAQEASGAVRLTGRVLLAEDGVTNQRVIAYYLEKAGAIVSFADNGRIARDMALNAAAAGAPFGVILMDMQMPEMDGYAATASLRASGYTGPIIALTANAMSLDRDKCMQCGCTDYLSKPIDRALLMQTVAERLQESPLSLPDIQSQGKTSPAILRSAIVGDAEMAQFLPAYVADLREKVAQMATLVGEQNIEELKGVLHQIKGTGGFYGFDPLTNAAEQIEQLVASGTEVEVEKVASEVASLIELIRSVEGYEEPEGASAGKV